MDVLDKPTEVASYSHRKRDSTSESSHESSSSPLSADDDVISVCSKDETSSRDSRLEDRKRAICDEMRMRMENRRKEWNVEVDRLRRDFFQQRTSEASIAPSVLTEGAKEKSETPERVNRSPVGDEDSRFVVGFDLSSFLPNEIVVKTEDRKLIVSARHEEKSSDGKRTTTRTFNRQIDIPRNVDAGSMRCTLAKDGMLHLEANAVPRRRSSLDAPVTPEATPPTRVTLHSPSIVARGPKVVDPQNFSITVSVGRDFLPEDLAVRTVDQKLIVSARREVERPGNTSMKEFHREFDLPSTVDPTTVTASMTETGDLLIEAPLQGSEFNSPSVVGS